MSEEYSPLPLTYIYSEAEHEAYREGLKKLPTYLPDPDGRGSGSVSTSQMRAALILVKKENTPEQVATYTAWWDKYYNGRIIIDIIVEMLKGIHSNEMFFRVLVKGADLDEDGFISRDEFKGILEILLVHDAKLAALEATTFENFVKEADINLDGKVSLEECVNWITKKQEALQN